MVVIDGVLLGVTELVGVVVGVTDGVVLGVIVSTTKLNVLLQVPVLCIVPPVIGAHMVVVYPVNN